MNQSLYKMLEIIMYWYYNRKVSLTTNLEPQHMGRHIEEPTDNIKNKIVRALLRAIEKVQTDPFCWSNRLIRLWIPKQFQTDIFLQATSWIFGVNSWIANFSFERAKTFHISVKGEKTPTLLDLNSQSKIQDVQLSSHGKKWSPQQWSPKNAPKVITPNGSQNMTIRAIEPRGQTGGEQQC